MGGFIVLEGLDGAGTTTQAERLVARLAALCEVVATREPTSGPVGRLIRSTLRAEADAPARSTLPWMFAADRSDHLARVVEPAVERGAWVVSDRYVPSSLAYQSLDLPLDVPWGLNQAFRAPDLLLFLKVAPDVALERVMRRAGAREIFEEADTLRRVAHQYAVSLDRLRQRGDRIVVIDGSRGVDEVEAQVWAAVQAVVGAR